MGVTITPAPPDEFVSGLERSGSCPSSQSSHCLSLKARAEPCRLLTSIKKRSRLFWARFISMAQATPSRTQPKRGTYVSLSLVRVIHLGEPPPALTMPSRTSGLGSPTLGYFSLSTVGCCGNEVSDWVRRHFRLVHLQKHKFFPVRRPEIIAAHGQFFRINPVHFAVEQIVIAIFGDGNFLTRLQWESHADCVS